MLTLKRKRNILDADLIQVKLKEKAVRLIYVDEVHASMHFSIINNLRKRKSSSNIRANSDKFVMRFIIFISELKMEEIIVSINSIGFNTFIWFFQNILTHSIDESVDGGII